MEGLGEVAVNETVGLSRGNITKALVNNGKEFRLESEKSWKPVKNFRQEVNIIRHYDRSLWVCGESFIKKKIKIHCR